ncbi:MAG: hypothetical protein ACQEXJ_21905 [Myxococcota bacterium]
MSARFPLRRAALAVVTAIAFAACGEDDGGIRLDVSPHPDTAPDAPGTDAVDVAPDPGPGPDADAADAPADPGPGPDAAPDAPDATDALDVEADVGPDAPEVQDAGAAADADADAEEIDASDGLGPIPTEVDALRTWLGEGGYEDWASEAQPHPSAAGQVHFTVVRAFANPILEASLEGGEGPHPEGSAAVMELYGGGSANVEGWAALIKTQADSDFGDGWFWFQEFSGQVFTAAQGAQDCVSCHSAGDDFVQPIGPLE